MTHFRIDIQLPLKFNKEDGGGKIPEIFYFETYEDLLNLVGGINTTNTPVMGSWINPANKKRYDNRCVVYTILVERSLNYKFMLTFLGGVFLMNGLVAKS